MKIDFSVSCTFLSSPPPKFPRTRIPTFHPMSYSETLTHIERQCQAPYPTKRVHDLYISSYHRTPKTKNKTQSAEGSMSAFPHLSTTIISRVSNPPAILVLNHDHTLAASACPIPYTTFITNDLRRSGLKHGVSSEAPSDHAPW